MDTVVARGAGLVLDLEACVRPIPVDVRGTCVALSRAERAIRVVDEVPMCEV